MQHRMQHEERGKQNLQDPQSNVHCMIAFSASRTKMCGIPGIDVRKLRHAFLLAGDAMLTATLYNFSWAFLRS
jgi:hypothetical protein